MIEVTAQPRRRASHGFTLTEILVALALVVLLLLGVSRVFTLTAETIRRGQNFSNAIRVQKSIGQLLANDIVGYAASIDPDRFDLGNLDPNSGNVPLTDTVNGPPFLIISNYRVPAYRDADEQKSDPTAPQITDTFTNRSNAIRSIDLNNDGDDTDPGETVSIYSPLRNYRCDTITFFSKGTFLSQIGAWQSANNSLANAGVSADYAMIHYGHLRLFNSDLLELNDSFAGYGTPGESLTPLGRRDLDRRYPNRNNEYASQFTLGRVQMLLKPLQLLPRPTGLDTWRVVDSKGDLVPVIARNWPNASADSVNGSRSPFGMDSKLVLQVNNTFTGAEYIRTDNFKPTTSAANTFDHQMMRTDVLGVSMAEAVDRMRQVITNSNPATFNWWNNLPGETNEQRYLGNPFPQRPFDINTLSQAQHIVSAGVTNFIIEFAGDFVTQNPVNGVITGVVSTANPGDGIDYYIETVQDRNGVNTTVRHIRWYGLPRDGDNDGVIRFALDSPDVVPVRDVRGSVAPFERRVPPVAANYLTVISEVGTSPDGSSYLCAWSPFELDPTNSQADITTPSYFAGVPSMVRVIVEVVDPATPGSQPLRQEYIFPLKQ